ncbi:MAG TPA: RsmE family RNA methyltransferase [Vicinamibacterales bacterium]|nr:RsmE family RNA methyltransferase [Vicinamibacterales bacterium]
MRPRFHLSALDTAASRGRISGEEAKHLIRVLRLGTGAEVEVLDGEGRVFRARVAEVARADVQVDLIEPVMAAPEPAVAVTLAMSVLKGDKMDAVVRDATMMGVTTLQPVVSARSETTRAALARGQRVPRWQRIALSSIKQCGRAIAPEIRPTLTLPDWLRQPRSGAGVVLVEPVAGQGRAMSDVPRQASAALLVGPEGGWTAGELAAIQEAGLTPVSLGGRTLRADVAPVAALAALFEAWRAW